MSCGIWDGIELQVPQSGVMDIDWIIKGLEKPGKTRAGLAKALGRNPSMVTNLLKGERQLKMSEVARIANYLEVLPIYNGDDWNSEFPREIYLELRGEVAAGVWSEPEIKFEPAQLPIPLDPRWPVGSSFLLRVRGNSISRKAQDGDLAVCLDVLAAPREFQPGDWVVAERRQNGLVETTIKKVGIVPVIKAVGDVPRRLLLLADSDDLRFQEPIGFTDADETVKVRAFVLQFLKEATSF